MIFWQRWGGRVADSSEDEQTKEAPQTLERPSDAGRKQEESPARHSRRPKKELINSTGILYQARAAALHARVFLCFISGQK